MYHFKIKIIFVYIITSDFHTTCKRQLDIRYHSEIYVLQKSNSQTAK